MTWGGTNEPEIDGADRMRERSIGNIPRPLACLLGLLSLLVTPQAVAEDPVSEDWQFQVAPYVWAMAAEGDATVKGRTFDVDLSFKDIVEELNYGRDATRRGPQRPGGRYRECVVRQSG